jgi:hypothetical protein
LFTVYRRRFSTVYRDALLAAPPTGLPGRLPVVHRLILGVAVYPRLAVLVDVEEV